MKKTRDANLDEKDVQLVLDKINEHTDAIKELNESVSKLITRIEYFEEGYVKIQ